MQRAIYRKYLIKCAITGNVFVLVFMYENIKRKEKKKINRRGGGDKIEKLLQEHTHSGCIRHQHHIQTNKREKKGNTERDTI